MCGPDPHEPSGERLSKDTVVFVEKSFGGPRSLTVKALPVTTLTLV